MQGAWPSYVEKDLIPRLNGFEILMASYAMAHLKLDLLLTETGYKPSINQRFKVYLTNSLEESHPDTGTLFSNWLSTEANEANHIKRDSPLMCIIGNPPYSGISSNKGEWINNLIEEYKFVDGVHFNEKKHWLSDDYVKFLRYGQYLIEKNGSGVLAFINPHGFLDNPTFRGMRWNLLKAYDKIYTIDLHGNSNKKETSPDGSPDINVFDIQQGVAITIFVKTGKKKVNELGEILHYDLYGKRDYKYNFLLKNYLNQINFEQVIYNKPYYFLKPKDEKGRDDFEKGFKIDKLFPVNNVGFVSANDGLNISMSKVEQRKKIEDLISLEESDWRIKYKRKKDAQSWKYKWAKEDAIKNKNNELSKVSFRPFDIRYTLYTGKSGGLFARPSFQVMRYFHNYENVGLVIPKINKEDNCIFISKNIISHKLCSAYDSNTIFPLYIYLDNKEQKTIEQSKERKPNLNLEIVNQITENIGLTFTNEKDINKDTFAPIDILDYIYAILHSPTYRKKYNEFLKIDFPRVPYPEDQDTFWKLVKLGGEIRQIHLLESATVEQYITQFQIGGSDLVSRKMSKNSPGYVPNNETHGKVYINDEQYFDNVPLVAWEFYIGGYQPAQKWLKDRNGRKLEWEDIAHYQKIIVALSETDRIMNEIDGINI